MVLCIGGNVPGTFRDGLNRLSNKAENESRLRSAVDHVKVWTQRDNKPFITLELWVRESLLPYHISHIYHLLVSVCVFVDVHNTRWKKQQQNNMFPICFETAPAGRQLERCGWANSVWQSSFVANPWKPNYEKLKKILQWISERNT